MDECGTHTSLAPIYGYGSERRAIAAFGSEKAGQKHHAALEYDSRRDGTASLAVEGNHGPCLRDLPKEGARSEAERRTDSNHGQPRGA